MSVISANDHVTFDATTYTRQRGRPTLRARLAQAVQWVAEQPRRRAIISELETLSDHELADIGLSRATLHRVFERDFAGGRVG